MLFNSYSSGVLVSPKLHPFGEAARISQFLASCIRQQQVLTTNGSHELPALLQSHLPGLPGDTAFGNTEHFSKLPVEGIVIVATHDGKHIAVPEYTRRIAVMLHNSPLGPVHESTIGNLPGLTVPLPFVFQHTFMTPGIPAPFFSG